MKSFFTVLVMVTCLAAMPAAEEINLSELDLSKAVQGWNTPKANKSVTGKTLSIGKKQFQNGFGTHASSELWIKLDGQAVRFTSEVGIDDAQNGTGTVEFIVIGDGEILFRSDVIGAGEIKRCEIILKGIKQLVLLVTDGGDGTGNDHANWVNARFRYLDKPPKTIDRPKDATLPEIPKAMSIRNYVKKIPDGYNATLFAIPPDISYPVQICATPTGMVFIAIDKNGSIDKKPNRGSIVCATDTNNDGIADKFTTFVDNVDSPRGLAWDGKQLFCLHPPTLTVYRDTTGDGKADYHHDLVQNIGYGLAHHSGDHTANGIRLAIDGWIYCAIGDYGIPDATGSDGSTVTLRGGGVVRVRPDGSELELYATHTRNIFDIAIDPFLNGYIRDNTNDGDGWNSRLSYLVQSGEYGYPSLYKRFSDDIIQPLADYGGGSAVGSLFVDEPNMPHKDSHLLLTCDWGTSTIYSHPLTHVGAGFAAKQLTWARIDRVTDIDMDGTGHVYASSWRGAVFTYNGESVGALIRFSPDNTKASSFPDLTSASDADLVKTHLAAPSAILRQQAQCEIVRRGAKGVFTNELTALAKKKTLLAARIAAIFTLKQLDGVKSHEALIALTKDESIHEWALRALADRKPQLEQVPADPFLAGLRSGNPRVRAQALIGLGRLGKPECAQHIVPFTAVSDNVVGPERLIPHLAVRTLVTLHAIEPCFTALDSATTIEQVNGALWALRYLHDDQTVHELIARIDKSTSVRRLQLITTLAHLYYKEAEWDRKHWWGTRPDHQGPYYERQTWSGSAPIGDLFKKLIAIGGETAEHVIKQINFYKLKIDGLQIDMAKINDDSQDTDKQNQAASQKSGAMIAKLGFDQVITLMKETKGDAKLGEQLFLRQGCIACHTISNKGPQKGPYLGEIAKQYNRTEIIESIIKPNAKIAQGFTTQWFEIRDGQRLVGFVTSEGADTIEIRNIDGQPLSIRTSDIKNRGNDAHSMMPSGLVDTLQPTDLASLLAYFESLVGQ